ncbi:hypothetical protein J6590_002852 [Homalodisca vitripennis]|nr:hypothetical protein J6590_002852 [Homalodisca vitripennis]
MFFIGEYLWIEQPPSGVRITKMEGGEGRGMGSRGGCGSPTIFSRLLPQSEFLS